MQAIALKKELTDKLLSTAEQVDKNNRMKIAVEIKCSLATVDRYYAGQVRNMELAEKILSEAEKLLPELINQPS